MWSDSVRLNQRYMKLLAIEFGQEKFTTKQACAVYMKYCWKGREHLLLALKRAREEGLKKKVRWDIVDAYMYWPKVSARQYLSIATERGILIRVERGTYKFNK